MTSAPARSFNLPPPAITICQRCHCTHPAAPPAQAHSLRPECSACGRSCADRLRRLELAQALVHEPEMLFLDEPTLGLDVAARKKIWEHISALRKCSMTILMTIHYMEEADEYCDRVAIIDRGRIVVVDSPENLKPGLDEDASMNDVFLENVKTGEDQAGFDAFKFMTMLRRRS